MNSDFKIPSLLLNHVKTFTPLKEMKTQRKFVFEKYER